MTRQSSMAEISEKSKKNEILAAYEELLKRVSEENQVSHQQTIIKEKEETLVQTAAGMTDEKIVKRLADVKIYVGQSLDKLEQELTEEYKRLSDIQEAIQIESKNLQEIHEIRKNADSLAALFLTQKEYKSRFEKEIAEARVKWQHEKELAEAEQQEYREALNRQRTRAEEEYYYAFELKQKKDADAYQQKKETLERELIEKRTATLKELEERELIIKMQEEEFARYKKQVEQFPAELEKAVKAVQKETQERIANGYDQRIALEHAEYASERKLNQQTIATLQLKIKEQEDVIRHLTQKTDIAGQQTQEIALKALDSASKMRFYASVEDKKMTQSL